MRGRHHTFDTSKSQALPRFVLDPLPCHLATSRQAVVVLLPRHRSGSKPGSLGAQEHRPPCQRCHFATGIRAGQAASSWPGPAPGRPRPSTPGTTEPGTSAQRSACPSRPAHDSNNPMSRPRWTACERVPAWSSMTCRSDLAERNGQPTRQSADANPACPAGTGPRPAQTYPANQLTTPTKTGSSQTRVSRVWSRRFRPVRVRSRGAVRFWTTKHIVGRKPACRGSAAYLVMVRSSGQRLSKGAA
jgi:hypothetical protein